MIDVRNNQPLRIRNEGGLPYLQFSRVQMEDIKRALDENQVYYWFDPVSVAFNGEPPTMYIRFGRKGNAEAIQAILDRVS